MSTHLDPMIQPFTPNHMILRSLQTVVSQAHPTYVLCRPLDMANILGFFLCVNLYQEWYPEVYIPEVTTGRRCCQVMAGLLLTDANYTHSIALLEERYAQLHKCI